MRGFIKGVAPSTSLSFFLFLRKYLGPYGENCTFLKKIYPQGSRKGEMAQMNCESVSFGF